MVEVVCIEVPAAQVIIHPIPPIELVEKIEQTGTGGASQWMVNEIPTGAINGVNATFQTMYSFAPDSVLVYLNGQRLKRVADFNTFGSNEIILMVSPGVGEVVMVDYIKLN